MSIKKKNIPMMVAFAIPIFMILLITVSIYVPTMFIKPQFNFVYFTGKNYCHDFHYTVKNERIIKKENKPPAENSYCNNVQDMRVFYYDVQENISREVNYDEFKDFRVDNRYKSPDGFEVASGNRSGDIFFFNGSSYYEKYLKKGAYSRKLEMEKTYYYNFQFLGWIKE